MVIGEQVLEELLAFMVTGEQVKLVGGSVGDKEVEEQDEA